VVSHSLLSVTYGTVAQNILLLLLILLSFNNNNNNNNNNNSRISIAP